MESLIILFHDVKTCEDSEVILYTENKSDENLMLIFMLNPNVIRIFFMFRERIIN